MLTIDTLNWAWPQWTLIAGSAIDLLCYAVLNGKPRTGQYNFAFAVIGAAGMLFTLMAGGFFK